MSKIRKEASPSEKVIRVVNVAAGAHLRLPDWGTTRTNEKRCHRAPAGPSQRSAGRSGKRAERLVDPRCYPPYCIYLYVSYCIYSTTRAHVGHLRSSDFRFSKPRGPLRGLLVHAACGAPAPSFSLSLSPFAAWCERPSALERLLWLILVHHLLHLLELIIHCRGQHTLCRLECRELVVDAAGGLERFKLVVERRAFACGRARR